MPITTHVLDTSLGKPADQVLITLETLLNNQPQFLGETFSNNDGRISPFLNDLTQVLAGEYRLSFTLEEYFMRTNRPCFYPCVTLHFSLKYPEHHVHVPLLISPFGYSSYRGS